MTKYMTAKLNLASLAGMLSDDSRIAIVSSLQDGRALTAKELALAADITPQTASFHLKKLTTVGILEILKDGRHRYFKISGNEVAKMLRTMLELVPTKAAKPAAKKNNAVCFARTCYGHLAGRIGVAIAQSMIDQQQLIHQGSRDSGLTQNGENFITDFGIDLDSLRKGRRLFARQCLDWSERHPHLGGALGFALTEEFKRKKWITARRSGREIDITPLGQRGFLKEFKVDTKSQANLFFAGQ